MKRQRLILAATTLLPLMWLATNTVVAQERSVWGPTVTLRNGTYIQTGIGILPPDTKELTEVRPLVFGSSKLSAENSFRRLLKLADGRIIIYEVMVKELEEGRRFEVALRPVALGQSELQELGLDPGSVESKFLQNYSLPLIVNDGDIVALDVLANPRTGAKLVDYFRVSRAEPRLTSNLESLSATARQIAVKDIELAIVNGEIRRNGVSVHKSSIGVSGRYIWVDIPEVGRFLFSLAARVESEDFQPTAFVSGKEIVFSRGPDRYELMSDRTIVPATGVFRLWVRYDPNFSFPLLPAGSDRFRMGALDYLPSQH
jgi:hypothetical protein